MGMKLTDQDLLPGEKLLLTKFANMIVSVKEMGLSRFAFDDLLWTVGMSGKEAIGGEAYLTNYRVIFKSHFMNRVRGMHSIFLPNVTSVAASFNRLKVDTACQKFEFVMWFKDEFVRGVNDQKASLVGEALQELKNAVVAHPERIGAGLEKWATLEIINQICLGARKIHSVLEKLSVVEKSTFLEIVELLKPEATE